MLLLFVLNIEDKHIINENKNWWKNYKEAGLLEGFKRCIKVMILYNINLFVMVMDYKKEMSVLTVQHIKSKIPKEGV